MLSALSHSSSQRFQQLSLIKDGKIREKLSVRESTKESESQYTNKYGKVICSLSYQSLYCLILLISMDCCNFLTLPASFRFKYVICIIMLNKILRSIEKIFIALHKLRGIRGRGNTRRVFDSVAGFIAPLTTGFLISLFKNFT